MHPLALDLLTELKLPTEGLRSKSWDEFAAPGAPELDCIFTVCDNAANETCPIWPGKPITAHWGLSDPAAVEGSEAERKDAFRRTLIALESRVRIFLSPPFHSLDRMRLEVLAREIGKASSP